jgi:hypothetical protein
MTSAKKPKVSQPIEVSVCSCFPTGADEKGTGHRLYLPSHLDCASSAYSWEYVTVGVEMAQKVITQHIEGADGCPLDTFVPFGNIQAPRVLQQVAEQEYSPGTPPPNFGEEVVQSTQNQPPFSADHVGTFPSTGDSVGPLKFNDMLEGQPTDGKPDESDNKTPARTPQSAEITVGTDIATFFPDPGTGTKRIAMRGSVTTFTSAEATIADHVFGFSDMSRVIIDNTLIYTLPKASEVTAGPGTSSVIIPQDRKQSFGNKTSSSNDSTRTSGALSSFIRTSQAGVLWMSGLLCLFISSLAFG